MGTPVRYIPICIERNAAAGLSFAERYKRSLSLGWPTKYKFLRFIDAASDHGRMSFSLFDSSRPRVIDTYRILGRGPIYTLKKRPFYIVRTRAHGRATLKGNGTRRAKRIVRHLSPFVERHF